MALTNLQKSINENAAADNLRLHASGQQYN